MDAISSSWIELSGLPLFCGLSVAEIEKFVTHTAAEIKTYDKGEMVLKPYESNTKIGVVVKGNAQVISEDWMGNETIGHGLERGALLGGTSAILSEEYSPTAIQSLTKMTVLWIPYRSLIIAGSKLGRIHGIVMQHVLEAFCNKNVLMMEKLALLSLKSLRQRIILYMLQKEKHQKSERIKMPRRIQLAKELECHRSALTRELSLIKEEGILSDDGECMWLVKEQLQC